MTASTSKPVSRRRGKSKPQERDRTAAQQRYEKAKTTRRKPKLSKRAREAQKKEQAREYLRKYRKTDEYRAYARKYWSEWAKKNPKRLAAYRKKHRAKRLRYNRLWWRGLVGKKYRAKQKKAASKAAGASRRSAA